MHLGRNSGVLLALSFVFGDFQATECFWAGAKEGRKEGRTRQHIFFLPLPLSPVYRRERRDLALALVLERC